MPTLVDEEVVPVAEENGNQVFQDSWLSFEYPEDVKILADGQGEGRASRWLTFMVWNEENGTYSPVDLVLKYPTRFEDSDFYSFKESYAENYDRTSVDMDEEAKSIYYYEELTVDGRDAFLTSEGGFGAGPYITLYIVFDEASEEYTSSDAYQLATAGVGGSSSEQAKMVLDLFIETAKFYK